MKLTIIACGNKMPEWVNQGVDEYLRRLKEHFSVSLIEVPLMKRGKDLGLSRILTAEAASISALIPANAYVIALHIEGVSVSSEELSTRIDALKQNHAHLCFIIGGPEGLAESVLKSCHAYWSLSKLTLPHPIVRVVLMEALYRAWSISANHPYHK